jgi:subfamily B ATP-binding cassette protein MsbA
MFKVAPEAIPEKARFMDVILSLFSLSVQELVKYLPWILVIVIFGKGLFTFLSSFFMRSVGLKIVRKMRNDLYDHLIYQSSEYFDRSSTGRLMSRLTSDVDKIQEALSGSAKDFIQEIFILFALLIGVFLIDWHLALASIVITPLAVVPLAIFSQQLKKISKLNQARMAEIFNLLHETITGNKIVKAFTMERFELKKFYTATKHYLKTSIKLAWIGSLSSPFMEFLGGVVGAFILFIGTDRIAKGHISPGDFGAFVMAIFMMYTPIKRLSRSNNVIQQGVACYERVQEIFKAKPIVVDNPRAYPLPLVTGRVTFKDVTFSYDEAGPVLRNVNFEVNPKEMVALVGLSGSGKTTIINLLSRFYDPSSGKILIDGIDIKEVTVSSLRSQIGLVTQELILFNDSVRNNIAYGLEEIGEESIIEAAKTAQAHDFIMNLSQDYDTLIGEKGGLLSSGQKQRLSIARALLKNPPLLILDEATSALDTESERLIQIAMDNVMRDRTTFVIAHRLSTIRNAHKIFVIDRGQIAEIGSHEELIKQDGIYKKLYDLQFPEEKEI